MNQTYGIDLTTFTLESLREFLAHGDLLPSHRVLREELNGHFSTLAAHGITNVQQLVDKLTTKKAVERVASETGIPINYLAILRRHVRGYIPSPISFAEIPGLDEEVLRRLAGVGIKHTQHLFERAHCRADRTTLIQQTGIAEPMMLELVELTDLSRLAWVGPIGVRLFHEAGARAVAVVTTLEADTFCERIIAVNRERQYTRATITRRDIVLIFETARKLPSVIEY